MMLLLFLLAAIPLDTCVRENVDQIEVNHVFAVDDCGITKHVFSQLIFRDWNSHAGRFDIRAWRMMKPGAMQPIPAGPFDWEVAEASKGDWSPAYASYAPSPMVPTYSHEMRHWEVRWMDGEIERVITSPVLKTTFTIYDPELTERALLPKEKRTELRRKPARGSE
jgi:hypothetical protein